jgi:hypothetical protein
LIVNLGKRSKKEKRQSPGLREGEGAEAREENEKDKRRKRIKSRRAAGSSLQQPA